MLVNAKRMKPNIKQRKTEGTNSGLRYRREAAELLVEGIFGAEETENGLEEGCKLR
jgi:hypothetical protein